MISSTLTSKGQTTIPKEIRDVLGLKTSDRIIYECDRNEVRIRSLTGDVLQLRGTITPARAPEDFKKVRAAVKRDVGMKAGMRRGTQ